MNRLGRTEKEDATTGTLVYIGMALGAGVAGYLVPKPGRTEAAAMPSVAPPPEFANLAAVATRFDEVKTLYRSGRLDFQTTRDQVAALIDVAFILETQGKANAGPVAELAQAMSQFHDDTFRAEQEIERTQQPTTLPA